MKYRDPLVFVEDILESMDKIESYVQGMDFSDFAMNDMVIDAVLRNLEIIGEASRNIPDDIRERYSEIPWKEMMGLRNIVIHGYFSVDLDIIWEIITEDIPPTRTKIEKMFRELSD